MPPVSAEAAHELISTINHMNIFSVVDAPMKGAQMRVLFDQFKEPSTSGGGGGGVPHFDIEGAAADGVGSTTPQEPQEPDQFNAHEAMKAALLDMTKEITPPDYRLNVGGVPIIPSGAIVVITGGAKQGKSQWCNIMAAVMLSGGQFGTMTSETRPKRICYFDTEQTAFDVQTNMRRLYAAAGIPDGTDANGIGFYPFMLRPFSAEERLNVIIAAIEATDPDIVIIDGIRDLLHDFNDIRECDRLMTWLLKTTSEMSHANFFCVIHTNEGSEKIRGHLGTEIFNKCGDRFDVSIEGEHFKVRHISKHRNIKPFLFRINEAGRLEPYEAISGDDPAEVIKAIFENAEGKPLYLESIVNQYKTITGVSREKARDAVGKAIPKMAQVVKNIDKTFSMNFSQ